MELGPGKLRLLHRESCPGSGERELIRGIFPVKDSYKALPYGRGELQGGADLGRVDLHRPVSYTVR